MTNCSVKPAEISWRLILIIAILVSLVNQPPALSQIPIPSDDQILPNPSFEGPGGENNPPPYWIPCGLTSHPDRQPNQVDVHLPPSDGESYISMRVRGATTINTPAEYINTRENVYSELLKPLQQGMCYFMTVDLAYDNLAIYFGELIPTYPSVFRVWGSNNGCDTMELLAESPVVEDTTWKTFDLLLNPKKGTYNYIFLEPYYAGDSTYHGLLLVDNIQLSLSGQQTTILMDTLVWPGTEITFTPSEADSYFWLPAPGLDCYNCRNPKVITEFDQTYTVYLVHENECPLSELFLVNILTCDMLYPAPNVVKLDTILTDFVNLTLSASDGFEYSWSPDKILSCNDCRNPYATIERPVTITCTLKDEHQCAHNEIFRFNMELSYPNVITPNGDGKNDLFIIKGLPENSKLVIFDRYGKLVFETNNYQNSWRGTDNNGNLLPEDTYWFVLSEPTMNIFVKDFVLIKR
jgi:gliding motility-associated-like protein